MSGRNPARHPARIAGSEAQLSAGPADLAALAFEHASVALLVVRAGDLRIERANAAARALAPGLALEGSTPGEVLALPSGSLDELCRAALRTGGPVTVSNQALAVAAGPDRPPRTACLDWTVRRIEGPCGPHLLCVAADATERRRLAAERERAERRLEQTVRDVPVFRFEVDFQRRRFIDVNETMCRYVGSTREEMLALDPMELLDEDSRRRFGGRIERWLGGEEPEGTVEYRVRARDGRLLDVVLDVSFLRDAQGRPSGARVIGRDVTERKRAEAAIRSGEERYRTLVMTSPDAILVHDGHRVRFANPAALRLVGAESLERLAGVDVLRDLIPDEDREVVAERVRAALEGDVLPLREGRIRRLDGREVPVEMLATPIDEPDGRAVRTIARDISERRRAQEELRRQTGLLEAAYEELRAMDRRRSEFLAVLSHELRNPLAPIRNGLFVLEHAAPGGEQARRALEIVRRQAAQLTRLVDDLLDFTRLSRNRIRLRRERVDLNALVGNAVDDHRALFERGEVHLALAPAAERPTVRGDRERLAQAIGNLLQNAAKFTGRGGAVRVSTALDAAAGRARVRVLDTGIGMTPEVRARLFEPFTQVQEGLDRRGGGLGLGLALVKELVERHGGEVAARSEGPRRGSEFEISLPLETGAEAARADEPRAPARRRRVLVIEDNADSADSLREVLEISGHAVAVAYDGREGIERARAFLPEVVLCDIGLPGMDGYEVARSLRRDETLGEIRLVALTGYALPEDVERAKSAGFDRHVSKPVESRVLESLMEDPGM